MDLFEDNEGLYKTGEKAYSNRESKYLVLLQISHIFPGKTGEYLYYCPAAWRTLMVESVNLLGFMDAREVQTIYCNVL